MAKPADGSAMHSPTIGQTAGAARKISSNGSTSSSRSTDSTSHTRTRKEKRNLSTRPTSAVPAPKRQTTKTKSKRMQAITDAVASTQRMSKSTTKTTTISTKTNTKNTKNSRIRGAKAISKPKTKRERMKLIVKAPAAYVQSSRKVWTTTTPLSRKALSKYQRIVQEAILTKPPAKIRETKKIIKCKNVKCAHEIIHFDEENAEHICGGCATVLASHEQLSAAYGDGVSQHCFGTQEGDVLEIRLAKRLAKEGEPLLLDLKRQKLQASEEIEKLATCELTAARAKVFFEHYASTIDEGLVAVPGRIVQACVSLANDRFFNNIPKAVGFQCQGCPRLFDSKKAIRWHFCTGRGRTSNGSIGKRKNRIQKEAEIQQKYGIEKARRSVVKTGHSTGCRANGGTCDVALCRLAKKVGLKSLGHAKRGSTKQTSKRRIHLDDVTRERMESDSISAGSSSLAESGSWVNSTCEGEGENVKQEEVENERDFSTGTPTQQQINVPQTVNPAGTTIPPLAKRTDVNGNIVQPLSARPTELWSFTSQCSTFGAQDM